jgi:hypothetical protein
MQTTRFRRSLIYLFTCVVTVATLIVFVAVRSQASRTEQTNDTPPARNRQAQQEEQARAQRLRELAAKSQDPGMLLLRAAEFDPLKNTPAALSIGNSQLEMVKTGRAQAELQASEAAYLIVQFDDIIQPQQTEDLRARGYEIKAYVPNNAYIVKAPRAQQARLLENRALQ